MRREGGEKEKEQVALKSTWKEHRPWNMNEMRTANTEGQIMTEAATVQ